MTPQAIDILIGTGAFVGILFLYFGPFQWWIVDGARQMMFEARDDLFDLAANGRLSFDDERYRTIRTDIESLIRFAHRASVFKTILLEPVMERIRRDDPSEMEEAIRKLGDDPKLQREVKAIILRAQWWLIALMIARNPLTLITGLLVLYVGISPKRRAKILGAFRTRVQRDARLEDQLSEELRAASHVMRAAA